MTAPRPDAAAHLLIPERGYDPRFDDPPVFRGLGLAKGMDTWCGARGYIVPLNRGARIVCKKCLAIVADYAALIAQGGEP